MKAQLHEAFEEGDLKKNIFTLIRKLFNIHVSKHKVSSSTWFIIIIRSNPSDSRTESHAPHLPLPFSSIY